MLKTFALFLSLTLALPVFAHESLEPSARIDFTAPKAADLTNEEVQALIHQSHELIEGDESGKFIARWKEAFNFKQRFVDGWRWSSSMGDNKYRDLAVDSLFLFGLSHGTEMMSGPVLLGIGYAHAWPDWVMGTIASGGTLISIPGLDPLCMIVFAGYAKSEGFRKTVGWMRVGTLSVASKIADKTGMRAWVARAFARPDLREYLQNVNGLTAAVVTDDEAIGFQYELKASNDRPAISLNVIYKDGKSYLDTLQIHEAGMSRVTREEFKNFTRQFGWNARDFIKQAIRAQQEKPYIEKYENLDGVQSYELRANAITIHSKRDCASLLTAKN